MDKTALRASARTVASPPDPRQRAAIEDNLRASRDHLAAILEAVGDGITVGDTTGAMVYANRMAAVGAGFTSGEELVARPVVESLARYDVLDEDGRPLPHDALPRSRVLQGEGAQRTVLRFRERATGVERWYIASATPILDGDGRLQQVVSVFRDVTVQHEARRLQEERARQQAALLELTRLALVDDDLDGLLDAAARFVAGAVSADLALIGELSSDSSSFFLRAVHSNNPILVPYRRTLTFRAGHGSLAGYCLERGEPVVANDLAAETRFAVARLMRIRGIHSAVGAPIPGAARPFGALVVQSRQRHAFSTDAVQFVSAAAGIIATAIERVRQRAELAASERRYRTIVETAIEGIWTVDAAGCTTFVNPTMAAMLGYTVDEMAGANLADFVVAEDQPLVASTLARRSQGMAETHEARMRAKDGRVVWGVVRTNPLYNDDGTFAGALAMITDLSPQREREAFKYSALHDALTGLPNRVLFGERLAQVLAASVLAAEPCAVAVLDLDGFKPVNDAYGHITGDLVLQQVAVRLRRVLRQADTAARLGGDEFALVLPATDADGALAAAEKVRSALMRPIDIDGHRITVSVSIGIAVHPEHGRVPATLTERADAAMYHAKRLGAGVCVADHAPSAAGLTVECPPSRWGLLARTPPSAA